MRDRPSDKVEAGRIRTGEWQSPATANFGAFLCLGPCGRTLHMLVTDGLDDSVPGAFGWEHVSVSLSGHRPPNWQEMCWAKEQFWDDDETVLQFHPKKSEYVNCHPHCLHLWRNVGLDHPLPPSHLVGPKI